VPVAWWSRLAGSGGTIAGMTNGRRVAIAFAVAPLVPIGLLTASTLLVQHTRTDAWQLVLGLPRLAFGFLIFAYPAELAIAVPAHQRLSQRGTNSAFVYCCLGAVTGAAPFVLIFVLTVLPGLSQNPRAHRVDFSESFWLGWALIGLTYGIISAIAFWFMAVRPTRKQR
jgi:hypothetical protein